MPNMNLSSLTPLLGSITSLGSAGAGLFNSYENNKYQDMLRSYAGSPQKLQSYAAGFTQPLAAGLTQGVNNQAQGYAAERGLASSPALEQQIESQAIAPYIQQQQSQAMQTALQALGLGGGAQPNPAGSFGQLGSGIQGLLKQFQGSGQQNYTGSAISPVQLDSTPSQPAPIDLTNYGFDPSSYSQPSYLGPNS